MILITLSQVLCTKFLRPPHKRDNGWLVMVVIALLVIAWLIIIKKPSLWQELKVDDIFPQCSNVLTSSIFIELFDSSSCEDLTPLPSSTKLSKGIFQSYASLSLKPSTPVGSILSIVFCLCMMVLPRQTSKNCKLWIMTRSLCEKSNSYQLLLMGMFCLNCRRYFQPFTTLPNCKAWKKNTMAMLGVSWSQPI